MREQARSKIIWGIAILLLGAVFLTGSNTRKDLYPKNFTMYGQNTTKKFHLQFPEDRGGYSHWWLKIWNLKTPNSMDSLSIEYCIAPGLGIMDTLTLRPVALRYAQNYTGGTAKQDFNFSFHFADSGTYCLRINQDGIGYDYADFEFTHIDSALADCLRISISQTMNY